MQDSKGDFCLGVREKVKKVIFCFSTFVHALRERAVFDAVEVENRTFEGESFFNRSSVSHLKHVTVKTNSAILRAIKFFSCTPVIDKDGHFKKPKTKIKQSKR